MFVFGLTRAEYASIQINCHAWPVCVKDNAFDQSNLACHKDWTNNNSICSPTYNKRGQSFCRVLARLLVFQMLLAKAFFSKSRHAKFFIFLWKYTGPFLSSAAQSIFFCLKQVFPNNLWVLPAFNSLIDCKLVPF